MDYLFKLHILNSLREQNLNSFYLKVANCNEESLIQVGEYDYVIKKLEN